MRFDGSIVVNTLWPERKQLVAGQTEFLVLNHCLPSTRGDRDTSVDGIRAAVPPCTPEMIKRLQAARALLPVADAHLLYKGSRIWIRHEWYLALLSYLESIADGQSASTRSALDADGGYIEDISTLYRRRTVRTFSDGSVSVEALKTLLGRSLSGIPNDNWTVSIMPRNVEGLDDLLYRWQEGGLVPVGQPISPAVVAKMSAGQTAASAGALTVWLSRLTDIGMPAQYVMDLIDLGRLGQRICEVATEMGLAVFLTPAVYDRDTCNHLNLKQADSMLTYLFSVGVPHSEPSTAVHEDVRRP
jgi:Nitroreductase family